MIWDLSLDDDNVIVDSSRQKELHQEPVTKVSFTSKILAIFPSTYSILSRSIYLTTCLVVIQKGR